jgi:uncharacterized coiled-coil protein SlyX
MIEFDLLLGMFSKYTEEIKTLDMAVRQRDAQIATLEKGGKIQEEIIKNFTETVAKQEKELQAVREELEKMRRMYSTGDRIRINRPSKYSRAEDFNTKLGEGVPTKPPEPVIDFAEMKAQAKIYEELYRNLSDQVVDAIFKGMKK